MRCVCRGLQALVDWDDDGYVSLGELLDADEWAEVVADERAEGAGSDWVRVLQVRACATAGTLAALAMAAFALLLSLRSASVVPRPPPQRMDAELLLGMPRPQDTSYILHTQRRHAQVVFHTLAAEAAAAAGTAWQQPPEAGAGMWPADDVLGLGSSSGSGAWTSQVRTL